MSFENIQIEQSNFTTDRAGATFFSLDHVNQRMVEKNSNGSTVFNYLLDTNILEVQSLQHDGVYFWSLENQGVGFRVRQWEISSSNVLTKINEYSFINNAVDSFDVYSLAVESYSDSLSNVNLIGDTELIVNDGSIIRLGDAIVVGPSTAVGYEGVFSHTTVVGKSTDKKIVVSPAIDADFSPGDKLYFTRSFFVFSDTAPGSLSGALYKYRSGDGFPLAVSVSNLFNSVRASTFYSGKLLFVRGGEVIWFNPDSHDIFKSQAIDNLNASRSEYNSVYDLTAVNDVIYRLEQKKVFFNGSYKTEDWFPLFNYNTSNIVPEVYFVSVKAEPPMVHKVALGVPVSENKSKITVTVLDQFRVPVFNRVVDLTTTGGVLSSLQEITDANGQVEVEYTADGVVGEVTVTATVV